MSDELPDDDDNTADLDAAFKDITPNDIREVIEPSIMASEPHIMRGVKCNHCAGDGWTVEYDPNDPHENGCSGGCPIQVQCEKCKGTGYTS